MQKSIVFSCSGIFFMSGNDQYGRLINRSRDSLMGRFFRVPFLCTVSLLTYVPREIFSFKQLQLELLQDQTHLRQRMHLWL